MALPLPKVVADVGPGGGLVTAMGGMNALRNALIQTDINKIKKQYAPITAQSEAASKLAYANLMGPQFLAKLMGNDAFMGNLTDEQKVQAKQMALRAGMGQGTGNAMLQMPSGGFSGVGQESTNNFSGHIANAFKSLLGLGNPKSQNPMQQQAMPQGAPAQQMNALQPPSQPLYQDMQGQNPADQGENTDVVDALTEWRDSPEGQRELKKGVKANIPDPEEALALKSARDGQNRQAAKTYEEKAGLYKGVQKEGAELGKHRADTINDIGQQQMQLSTTGSNLDRIIDDINAPEFMALRKDFPFYQDMQLKAFSKIGTPEQQEMIGNFIADVKSFAGATVNSFKGQSMKREFDYADQLKPNENDTVNSARGKLTALKSLKQIAEKKNDIILDLMQNQHMNLGDAVKIANKNVDIRAIDKQVKEATQPTIAIRNKKTKQILHLTLRKAREMGVPNV